MVLRCYIYVKNSFVSTYVSVTNSSVFQGLLHALCILCFCGCTRLIGNTREKHNMMIFEEN